MKEQLSLFELPSAVPFCEPRDRKSRELAWRARLSAVIRTFNYVAGQLWTEPIPFVFVLDGDEYEQVLEWTVGGWTLNLFGCRTSESLRQNTYDLVWSSLWRFSIEPQPSLRMLKHGIMSKRKSLGEVARAAKIKEATLRRFIEEARSEEARALYSLELVMGGQ